MQIVTDHDLGTRDTALPYGTNAPGLYADETVFRIDRRLVAASVEPHWVDGGQGLAFVGWARLLAADGSTIVAQTGDRSAEVETSVSYTAQAALVRKLGEAVIARELTLALLGEPQTLADGGTTLLMMSADALDSASIRNGIRNLRVVERGIDLAAVMAGNGGE